MSEAEATTPTVAGAYLSDDVVRSHRSPLIPRSWGRIGRRIVAVLAVVAAVSAGYTITRLTPDVDRQQQPFVTNGMMGHVVSIRQFDADVLGVRGAPKLTDDGTTYTSGGIWVIVTVRVTAHPGRPVTLGYAALRDAAGNTYGLSFRFIQPGFNYQLEPGVPVTLDLAFEVPESAAGALSIDLAANSLDQRMDGLARIGIPSGPDRVRAWATAASGTLHAPRIGE